MPDYDSATSSPENSIAALRKWGREQLKGLTDTAALDVDVLLCHLLGKPSSYLLTWPEKVLVDEVRDAFVALLQRRAAGEPIAHITGYREFWSLPFEVSADTLIPRPDTELLIELALALPLAADARVIDLGTGTGAIALALASEQPDWQIWGCDRVMSAVELAKRNANRLNLRQVAFLQSDWLSAFDVDAKFNLIVTNPPYIDANDPHLSEGDVRFEPKSALVAENAGLADIIAIIEQAKKHLLADGWLMIEHGWQQGEAVRALLSSAGFTSVETKKDLGGNPRCTLAQFNA
ncbi:peptide chain release factor N(5)-glutamine methyltransferase [Corallincola platygyrae]|uniref:Release factor glutamine methyltransferase n=1 Tax=Corallincola platygyrae TaxID=1193278 RepID=A0ABW4XR81_9GAMM